MILHCPNVGIIFTHGLQLHGQAVGWALGRDKHFFLGCISESISVRCRMLILGRESG